MREGIDLRVGRAARNMAHDIAWEMARPWPWGVAYDGDARAQLSFAISRIAGVLSSGRLDCRLSLEMFPTSSPVVMNPERISVIPSQGYPQLAELLRRDRKVDSIPVVVALYQSATLWDGHRRWATYLSAGREEIPTWACRFSSGSGLLSIS